MDLNKLTIVQAHEGLKQKQFSSLELTNACLGQIKRHDKDINAFITFLEKQARDSAIQIDKKIASSGMTHILEGIPIGVKDNILVDEVKCTAGSTILENYTAVEDATVVKKLKNAGAILIGKTNLDEFAMGSSTENSGFGPVKNPLNTEYVPGGSSGGSTAAAAAHMCLGALGSDTGGSIRQPASFCGVVGLKPTYGRVSRYGLIAMASSLDQIGPIARSVDDVAALLSVIEGKDSLDATSGDPMFSIEFPVKEISLQNIRIGVPKEYFVGGIDNKVQNIVEQVIKKLENKGAEIIKVSLPHTEYALAVYYIIMPSEVSANLSRYDGIKYGLSTIDEAKDRQSLLDIYLQTRSKGFGEEVTRRIMLGTYALSAGYYEAYYLQAQKVRTLISQDFAAVFHPSLSSRTPSLSSRTPSLSSRTKRGMTKNGMTKKVSSRTKRGVDCLLTPTSPTPAFKLGEKVDDPLTMYLSDIYTVPVNLAGLPAISLPVGYSKGLPVGVQLIGNYFDEHTILQVGKVIETLMYNNV
ncbi:Asp-tRNA(Asn)/Glu-tRNA(Gln) amidotransferase subunit GatA [Patescibacteria group bacterium AH-259-L05]|nr:Asp-tRNA(Asn)/Glu-tRNA(Gln) amidotransferase subunit GatA [Patescibacteria group bacterium AH-259-L05]